VKVAGVVAFPAQLGSSVGDGLVEVEALGEETAGGEEEREVVEVGVDAVSHAGVLHFDGDFFAV
jgi:hypothetical protein